MKTDIQETIDRLRELDRVASPAPWWVGSSAESYNAIVCEDGDTTSGVLDACYVGERLSSDDPDLQIITETRNAIPVLLAEIERLTAENTQLLDTVAEAWDEGYLDKETEAPKEMIERGLRKRAQNPYKKDN